MQAKKSAREKFAIQRESKKCMRNQDQKTLSMEQIKEIEFQELASMVRSSDELVQVGTRCLSRDTKDNLDFFGVDYAHKQTDAVLQEAYSEMLLDRY